MTAQEAIERLEPAAIRDASGRYCFASRKSMVIVKVFSSRTPVRFTAQDKVAFRIDALYFTVEELESGKLRTAFQWEQLETFAAGEQETETGSLFQG